MKAGELRVVDCVHLTRAMARGELVLTPLVTRGRPLRYLVPAPRLVRQRQPDGTWLCPPGTVDSDWLGKHYHRLGRHAGIPFFNPRDHSPQLAVTDFEDRDDRGYVMFAGFTEREITPQLFDDPALKVLERYVGMGARSAMDRLVDELGGPENLGVAGVKSAMELAGAIQTQHGLLDDPTEAGKPLDARRNFREFWNTTFKEFVSTRLAPAPGCRWWLLCGQHYKLPEQVMAVLITSEDGREFTFKGDETDHLSNDGALIALRAANGRWRAGSVRETLATFEPLPGLPPLQALDAESQICRTTVGALLQKNREGEQRT